MANVQHAKFLKTKAVLALLFLGIALFAGMAHWNHQASHHSSGVVTNKNTTSYYRDSVNDKPDKKDYIIYMDGLTIKDNPAVCYVSKTVYDSIAVGEQVRLDGCY